MCSIIDPSIAVDADRTNCATVDSVVQADLDGHAHQPCSAVNPPPDRTLRSSVSAVSVTVCHRVLWRLRIPVITAHRFVALYLESLDR